MAKKDTSEPVNDVVDIPAKPGRAIPLAPTPPQEVPSVMGATFAERIKARQQSEKRIGTASNKAVTAEDTEAK